LLPLPGPSAGLPWGTAMPLRNLFVDMNSYFASVEQQDRPELRGRPVGVVPGTADTNCCIAASYEAKRHGVTTGTLGRAARRLCPDIQFVIARHDRYLAMHHVIRRAVQSCLPIEKVMSVDEMACKLVGRERRTDAAEAIGRRIKNAIYQTAGPAMRCSIGIGPNVLLAKVAADMPKPDGLSFIHPEDLPQRLHELKLTDFPGIGWRTERRFHKIGITTVKQMCALTKEQLATAWGSTIFGERWHRELRGEEVAPIPTQRRTVGHSRVLPPDLRNDRASKAAVISLLHKAAARLRRMGYWAGSLTLTVKFLTGSRWFVERRFPHYRDTLTLLQTLSEM